MTFFLTGAASVREATGKGLPPDHRVESRPEVPGTYKQLFRVMKLTSLILLIGCMAVHANGDAQQRIAINVNNVSLQKLFAEIEKKTNYTFFYDVTILKETKPVTLMVKEATVGEILKQALAGQALEFTITDKTIFVKKERRAVVEAEPADTGRGGGIKVKGVVLTEVGGVPVQGANVTVKQTEKGTITNARGEFELSYAIPAGSVLIISYVGYAPQNFTMKDGGQIRIYMKVAQNELDKAVVQAYGKTTQRLTTSDIATVTAEEIERQPVMNPLLALQGKVAGLDVNQTSGYASAPIKVELRGRAAINPTFTSDPLYIIDGVPLTVNEVSGVSSYNSGSYGLDQNGLSPANGQSLFFGVNPDDIESIEVLKDADATAIYGSRGANGVILVTTKKGKAGRTAFNLEVNTGTNRVDRFWDLMNTTQYLAIRRQAFINSGTTPDPLQDYDVNGTWDTTRYTDWQKVFYGGIGKNVGVQSSLSGGDARTTFRLSGGYNRNTGITTISGADQRASLATNFSHRSLDQRLSISSSSQFSYSQSNLINLPGRITLAPDAPAIYDSIGNLNFAGWAGKNQNTVAESQYIFGSIKQPYTANTYFLNSNFVIGYEIVRGLNLATSFGYNIGQLNQTVIRPIASQDPSNSPFGSMSIGNTRNINWIIEPQATFNTGVGKGRLSILVGATAEKNTTDALRANGNGYTSDLLINSISDAPEYATTENTGQYRYFGTFARIGYNWEDKYILDFNGRRDGSSRFGPGKQFGDFGSIGVGWIVSDEELFKKWLPGYLNFLKFTGSYGITGSDNVADYSYIAQYAPPFNTYPYNSQSVLVPVINPNPNFRWQSNRELEGAIALGLLNDRINIHVAWYRNRSGNQLVAFPTPLFTGFPNVVENSPALLQNTGWEFTVSANLVKVGKFSWSMNFNTAINQNKLVAYPNFSQSPYYYTEEIGKPLNMSWAFHYTGVDPQTGLYTFLDKNHDGVTNVSGLRTPENDMYVVNLTPKFFGGLGMAFQYGQLRLDLFFNVKYQTGQNAFINGVIPGQVNSNQPTYIIGKQWLYPGQNALIEKSTTTSPNAYGYFLTSDGVYTNSSFIRLSNLSVAYNLSSSYVKKVGLQGVNIFFHTNNLLIITKYKGLDPETQNFGGLPPVKIIVGGLRFNF
jgi:TonB-linked SusC/RagA family outer membrane protein